MGTSAPPPSLPVTAALLPECGSSSPTSEGWTRVPVLPGCPPLPCTVRDRRVGAPPECLGFFWSPSVSFKKNYSHRVPWVLLGFPSCRGCETVGCGRYRCRETLPPLGPRAAGTESGFLPPQVVDVAPELLRVCSLVLAESKIPPGEGGGRGQGQGEVGSSAAHRARAS